MQVFLFDTQKDHLNLLPFTYTRPAALIRCGITTLAGKWSLCGLKTDGFITTPFLQTLHPLSLKSGNHLYVRGTVIATHALATSIQLLSPGEALLYGTEVIAVCSPQPLATPDAIHNFTQGARRKESTETPVLVNHIWDIFLLNAGCMVADFQLITRGRNAAPVSSTNTIIGKHPVFAEKGVRAEACVFNTTEGPVYLGENSEVMEGSLIRGPVALGRQAVIKMGAKIYGGTTLGPHCKVGGEINNSVFFGYSNKAHDGFIGNSVIGEWCNLGADTNNSNLKNNYSEVSVWSYSERKMINTGRQFCGIFMGDHSKTGINTMLNTGTVAGVCSNIFGSDFPPKLIPSFSWGGASGFERYDLPKALESISRVMERRGKQLGENDIALLRHIFGLSDEK